MSIRKVLVATDFSATAEVAIEQAILVARRHNAELVVLHVEVPPMPLLDAAPQPTAVAAEYQRMLEETRTQLEGRLAQLRERLAARGVAATTALETGFPDDVIPRAASDIGADVIVLGTAGRTGLSRFVLGSTAERVVRAADRTVLVARPTRGAAPEGGYRRILVPVDFSDYSRPALDVAAQLAAKDAHVQLYHAWMLPGAVYMGGHAGIEWAAELRRRTSETCRERLAELEAHVAAQHPGIVAAAESEGPPRDGIDKQLAMANFDLVVVGSHGRRGFRRWTLGSVAELTVRHAPCSVAVVHATTRADATPHS